MDTRREEIAATFDRRAPGYRDSDWHRASAERLVDLCDLKPGDRVLDAGTGTGFAALHAARKVGPGGRVVGVDISQGMLSETRPRHDSPTSSSSNATRRRWRSSPTRPSTS
jgi:ubiquinone/menaquinone biosynthesis C-methylase UbiE